jgi:ribosomal protein S18 acetylase RimI-like enzyme
MNLELRPLYDFGIENAVDLMNRGFADYFVPIQLTPAAFLHMIRVDSLDLGCCRLIQRDDQPVGLALIARRGWSSRLATMCLIPDARNNKIGSWCVEQLLQEAKARNDRVMTLEVIETNIPAVRLYQKQGFVTIRRLASYTGKFSETKVESSLEEIDIREVANRVSAHGLDDLAWQIAGESLAQLSPPNKAYKLNSAYAVISNPSAVQVAFRSVIVEPQARKQGAAKKLIQAIIAQHPNKEWKVPALCPEEVGGLFERVGFIPDKFSQLQMIAKTQ